MDKEVHMFSSYISLKVNVIERLEFELAYYNVAVQHVSYYITRTPLSKYLTGTVIFNSFLPRWNRLKVIF